VALSDTAIRKAQPGDKPRKLADGRGLYLLVNPSGSRLWRFKYRHLGKEKLLSLGPYPDVPLAAARDRRDAARKLVAAGIDPSDQRKAEKAAGAELAANSFEVIAREWFERYRPSWKPSHGDRILARLERDVFPRIGSRPVAQVTPPVVLEVVRRIEARGALETAHRALANVGQVMRYAIATGRAERDPTPDLRGALPPVKPQHFAAVTEPAAVGDLLRAIEGYNGTAVTRAALRLAPLLFVRPGELRAMRWAEVDLAAREWRFIVPKTGTPHVVPLADQAAGVLGELHALTGRGVYAFPGARSDKRCMSENAVLYALRGLGIEKDTMTGHGFRAMARTILDEVLGFRVDLIEHQLAHAVKDANGRAYNRTAHLPERRKMMQAWADYLDKLKAGGPPVAPSTIPGASR
jgi:integrase